MNKKTIIAVSLLLLSFGAQAQTIFTVAGSSTAGYSGDGGPATSAELLNPAGVSIDGAGNMYIADFYNNCIRKVSSSGIISTVAGTTLFGFSGDGGAATSAQLYQPYRTAVDGSGNVYIIDQGNRRIRKVNAVGIISTFAGNGTSGYTGDGGAATAAEIVLGGIAVDATGNVYIGAGNCIRKINTSGTITTIAGNGAIAGYSGDGGPATAAEFNNANDIAFDPSGNLYICDQGRIRKINTAGIISTIAGNGTAGITGDGGPATAATIDPTGIAINGAGIIYFAQTTEQIIRKINTAGIISLYAGNGSMGFSGDGGAATLAEFTFPSDVALDAAGNLYICDQNNSRIRKVSNNATGIMTNLPPALSVQTFPNPIGETFTLKISSPQNEQAEIIITNAIGQKIIKKTAQTNIPTNISLDVPTGVYLLSVTTASQKWTGKIIK